MCACTYDRMYVCLHVCMHVCVFWRRGWCAADVDEDDSRHTVTPWRPIMTCDAKSTKLMYAECVVYVNQQNNSYLQKMNISSHAHFCGDGQSNGFVDILF